MFFSLGTDGWILMTDNCLTQLHHSFPLPGLVYITKYCYHVADIALLAKALVWPGLHPLAPADRPGKSPTPMGCRTKQHKVLALARAAPTGLGQEWPYGSSYAKVSWGQQMWRWYAGPPSCACFLTGFLVCLTGQGAAVMPCLHATIA